MKASEFPHKAGVHPETSALRNALARAGVVSPHTGKPFTEAMLLGVGGGVSFNYYVFQYKGHPPSLFLSGRHLLQDNVAFLEGACERLGVGTTVKETSSAKVAAQHLAAELESSGGVIAWVDLASLSYSGLPDSLRRHLYHVVTVYGVDEERDVAWVGDVCRKPLPVPREELARARAAISSQKNRLLSVRRPKAVKSLEGAIREGLRTCCEAAAQGRSWNTRIDGIRKWGELLTRDTKEGWSRVFVRGAPAFTGLARAYTSIELYGTGGGLLRGLYADFLEEARDTLELPVLGEVAGRYRKLARQWSQLARSLLPDEVPQFKQTRELLARYERLVREQGEDVRPRLHETLEELRAVRASVEEDFPLGEDELRALYEELGRQVLEIARAEAEALQALSAVVR